MKSSGRRIPLWLHATIAVVLSALAAFGLWYFFTDSRYALFKNPGNDQVALEIVRLVFYAIAGVGGVVALIVAYRRQRDNESAEKRENSKYFSERFAAATEQVSSDKAASRLAGVYAMANLADDWDAGRQMCINVLCAYLRMPYKEIDIDEHEHPSFDWDAHSKIHEEQQVRESIVNVIGEKLRISPVKGKTWHWCNFDFNGVVFDGGDLSQAIFHSRSVSFEGAVFPMGDISFYRAEFHGDVDFTGAVFMGARVTFEGAKFLGDATFFYNAKFTAGRVRFDAAIFACTDFLFDESEIVGGIVYFSGTEFRKNKLGKQGIVSFKEVSIQGGLVIFENLIFKGGELDLTSVGEWQSPIAVGYPLDKIPAGMLLPSDLEPGLIRTPLRDPGDRSKQNLMEEASGDE